MCAGSAQADGEMSWGQSSIGIFESIKANRTGKIEGLGILYTVSKFRIIWDSLGKSGSHDHDFLNLTEEILTELKNLNSPRFMRQWVTASLAMFASAPAMKRNNTWLTFKAIAA